MSFSPKDISSLAIWMDASDLSSMDLSNSTVTQWRDKSGKNNVTSASIGTPILISSGVNGKNVIRTNTSGYFYMDPLTNPANTTTVSAFVVATLTNNPLCSYGRLISLGKQSDGINNYDFSTTSNFIFCRDSANPTVSIYRNSTFQSASVTYDSPFLIDCVFDGTTCNGFFNGSNFANFASSGTFSFNRMGLGVNIDTKTTPTDVWPGYICEVLIFYGALTSGQRQQVEGYLAWKWGTMSNLPETHPYKYISPGSPEFNPTNISGCQFWLDAADSSSFTFSTNNNILTWKDKSLTKLIGSAINSPILSSNIQNGLSVVNLNGSNQYFNFGNVLNLGTNGLTIFMVTKFAVNTSNIVGMIAKTSYRPNLGRWGLYYDTYASGPNGIGVNSFIDDTGQILSGMTINPNAQMNIYTLQNDRSTNNTIYSNGTLGMTKNFTSSNSNLSNTDSLLIGCYGNSNGDGPLTGSFMNGNICEILVYFNNLSTNLRQMIEGYLAWKWGLQTNLPINHPYKTITPSYYNAITAVNNFTTDSSSIINYVNNTSETAPNIILNLKSSLKASALTTADKNTAKTNYISTLISKLGANNMNITDSSGFFITTNSAVSGLSTKPVTVLLPTISGASGTISLPATSTSNYYHIEMPTNTTITLSNSTPTVTLSYNGTNVSYNGQTKVLGDTIVINSKTYKIVALGSITLDEQGIGAGGDPHIYPLLGEPYDLPNIKRRFLLFNNKTNNLKIVCDCDFLTKQEIADSVFLNKSVTEGTFMTKIWIYHNDEMLLINMKDLTIIEKECNFNISEIYEDKYIFKKFYASMFILKNNIEFNGKSRNIKVRIDNAEYNIKLSLDLNCADHRNHIEVFGPDLLSCKGALISKNRY